MNRPLILGTLCFTWLAFTIVTLAFYFTQTRTWILQTLLALSLVGIVGLLHIFRDSEDMSRKLLAISVISLTIVLILFNSALVMAGDMVDQFRQRRLGAMHLGALFVAVVSASIFGIMSPKKEIIITPYSGLVSMHPFGITFDLERVPRIGEGNRRTVLVFSDPKCPACRIIIPELILKARTIYNDEFSFYFLQFRLREDIASSQIALLALQAGKIGRYFEFLEIANEKEGDLSRIKPELNSLGIDPASIWANENTFELDSDMLEELTEHETLGRSFLLRGTPYFVIYSDLNRSEYEWVLGSSIFERLKAYAEVDE